MRHVVSMFVVLCLAVGSLSAATFDRVTDATLVESAENVVVGHVLDASSRQRENGSIVTDYRLRIDDVLKGRVTATTITISEFGGTAPSGLSFTIPGSARYTPGDRVVAFVNARTDGTYFTSHMALGKFHFESRGDLEVLVRDADGIELEDEAHAMQARDAGAFVKYVRDAARGVAVDAYAKTIDRPASTDRFTPRVNAGADYALKGQDNVTPVRWPNCDTGCLIGYFWNGDQAGVVDDGGSIDNAMDAWNSHSGSFVNLGRGGTSLATDLTVFDNENTILINNTSSPDFGLCNGTIACGGVWSNLGTTHVFKGTTYASALNGDMLVRPGSLSATQFESIVAHELGHTISLRHSNQGTPSSNAALMRSSVPLGGAVLQQWDMDAMSELYGEGIPCVGPGINSTSGNGTIFTGQTRTLSVSANGTAPFTYQWYRGATGDTDNPVGTNSSSFTTPALTETTSYWVKVSTCTPAISTNSPTITVTVEECPTPAITNQPQNKNIPPNTSTSLSVAAQGGAPFTYQWYRGNSGETTNPVGTNSSTFNTPPLTQSTTYWVRVTNSCGLEVLSDTALIEIQLCPKPSFLTQPTPNQNVPVNGTANLTVTTSSDTAVTYQWYRGPVGNISNPVGTNSNSFTTPPLTETTLFWVRATNNCGSTDSQPATITVGTVCPTLTIASIPTTIDLALGEGATINVTPFGTGPFTYQWFQGNSPDTLTPVAGGTNSSLAVGPFLATGTARYWVRVTDACDNSIDSTTVVINIACGTPSIPKIAAPSISHYSAGYNVQWIGNVAQTSTFELQEALDPSFTTGLKTFIVNGELHHPIDPHLEITTDTRFYYRVRAIDNCTQLPTGYSTTTTTVITAPQPDNSSEFSISVPQDASQTFIQNYLVPGFGETATALDVFAITTDVPWLTVFPPSGALSAGGTTVQFTINPSLVEIGSTTGTVNVLRTNGAAARGGIATNATTGLTLPFTVSKVTPVSPAPRDANAPPGTLVVPAIAHADGIGTRFQSDVRIVNASTEPIDYQISYTPSRTAGTEVGKQLPLTIAPNETKGLDDLVKAWFGAGILGEGGLGTLEIRPLNGANPLATFASSRTYAIDSTSVTGNGDCHLVRCTLGQFIPALGLEKFIGSIASDNQARISLQQLSNSLDSSGFRTNLGFVEGSGVPATMLLTLRDINGIAINQVQRSIPAYGHEQAALSAIFGPLAVTDGRVEVEVISSGGKVSSYASVVDNATADPLLVFPVQAQKVSEVRYVLPGVAELDNGPASNFHTDLRIYNAGQGSEFVALNYYPQAGDATPRPPEVQMIIEPGRVKVINNVLPELWQLTRTGGAVTFDAAGPSSLVVTARTYSRDSEGGTYGQFIPAVVADEGVGLGDRALEVLQLEQSDQYRTNLGLVEVTGSPVRVEVLAQTGAKVSARTELDLGANEFRQIGRVFEQLGITGASYTGRVSVKVIGGDGKVSAYGSVVDNRTVDPTYVPAQ